MARLGPALTRYVQYRVHASGLASVLKDLILKRPKWSAANNGAAAECYTDA